ncbi:hypothetical protein FACS189472_12840 [Alphaproteobacteria bacterium]|nr:hypothetical protein FACS189472_12840 [Alphaproteobacteria bacterium]
MSDSDALVRQKLLKEISTAPATKWDNRTLDITPAKYVAPRSMDIQEKLQSEGVNVTAEQLQKILSIARPPPKRKVPYSDNKLLADVISHHGISHNPELNDIQTAQNWLQNRIERAAQAGDKKAYERWQKYAFDYQDFDDNPNTIDNVVVYNRENPGDVYSVDGYRLGSRNKSLVQRGYYGTFPTAEERKENKLSPEYAKYLSRYPDPRERLKHPFNDKFIAWYDDKLPLYKIIKEYVTGIANGVGFTIRVDPNDTTSDTKINNKSHTTIISRVSSKAYRHVRNNLFKAEGSLYTKLPSNYDFIQGDPLKLLDIMDFKKNMKAVWLSWSTDQQAAILPVQKLIQVLISECGKVEPKISVQQSDGRLIFNDPVATRQNEAKRARLANKAPINWKQIHKATNTAIKGKYGAQPGYLTDRGIARRSGALGNPKPWKPDWVSMDVEGESDGSSAAAVGGGSASSSSSSSRGSGSGSTFTSRNPFTGQVSSYVNPFA